MDQHGEKDLDFIAVPFAPNRVAALVVAEFMNHFVLGELPGQVVGDHAVQLERAVEAAVADGRRVKKIGRHGSSFCFWPQPIS